MKTESQLAQSILSTESYDLFGTARLSRPISFDIYSTWLSDGQHGDMTYLFKHRDVKEYPQSRYDFAKSAIVVGILYDRQPSEMKRASLPLKHLKIARYARGNDYHDWLLNKLKGTTQKLLNEFPRHTFSCHTDSSPILERDLAYRAGLGWFGKNSMLISQKKGSFFLIGEILTSLELEEPAIKHPDRCGTCSRCIEACPTHAINNNRTVDSRKCISYHTIESKADMPGELASAVSDWFFGCDICQEVCPWNKESLFSSNALSNEQVTSNESLSGIHSELKWLLAATDKELRSAFQGTPLSRAKPFGLRRNARNVARNLGFSDLLKDENS
ncbi:MAG: tRNA epoxyqueuosine(34) reductase QueG [Bdellovibrionales bacterium CG10_big_fil_rev_8_21_14_0_10_45_34]|nr:MAG: tRNA epoxyqueuosine(34) reductase QueG [Bdellovibrionales bacterium CG10_big_fil_rev_8_21_14_0_10_45_34]